MSAAILRRVLFSLAPVELAMVALMAAGVSLPTPLRLAVVTLLIATVLAELTIWTVDFFRNRRLGSTVAESAMNAAHHIIGERLWRFIASEFGLISSLVRLIARRPKVSAGSTVFTYHRQSSPVVWMMVAFLVIELVVLHLVIPWDAVRLVALILGIYGLLWVVGYVAGFAMHPHLLTEQDLIIRRGPTLAIVLPLDTIERVEAKDRDLPGWRSIRYRASSRSGGRAQSAYRSERTDESGPGAEGGDRLPPHRRRRGDPSDQHLGRRRRGPHAKAPIPPQHPMTMPSADPSRRGHDSAAAS